MDLTTADRLTAYLRGVSQASPSATALELYSELISRASDAAMQWTGRTFQRATYTGARLNGSGTDRLRLPSDPVISVSSVSVDGYAYSVSDDAIATGYQYDTRFVYLFGGPTFRRGKRNVLISFVTGYTTSQTGYVPAASPYTITPTTGSGTGPDGLPASTGGPAMVDRGVTYTATGNPLTAVGSSPAAGQYAFAGGVYTFAAADAGAEVTMSYDYVPGAVEQGVLELIGTKLAQRNNLGIKSQTLAQQTTIYMDVDLPASVKALWQPYRYVVAP